MMNHILLLGVILGGRTAALGNEELLEAIQNLYQYSTQAVQVEPSEMQRLLAEVDSQLQNPEGEVAQTYERLAAGAQKDQPDGREIRVIARDLYGLVENQQDQRASPQTSSGSGAE
jgi:hypothetical protein